MFALLGEQIALRLCLEQAVTELFKQVAQRAGEHT